MIDVGIASAAMNVVRKFHRKRKTTIAGKDRMPTTRCSSIALSEFSIKIELSPMIRISKVLWQRRFDLRQAGP